MAETMITHVFLLVYLLYPSNSAHIFATLQCVELDDPNHSSFLRKDFSIDCSAPFHQAMTVYAYVMIFAYPLGVPALYSYLLFVRYHMELRLLRALELRQASLRMNARNERSLLAVATSAAKTTQAQAELHASDELPAEVAAELEKLQEAEAAQRAVLPDYVQKIILGYELRTYYFELIECARKLLIACVPVFFTPSGSVSQLVFGLVVAFGSFGALMLYAPYVDAGDNRLAQLCQVQIFVALLASVVLKYDTAARSAATNVDVLLTSLTVLPIVLALVLETPLAELLCLVRGGGEVSSAALPVRRLSWRSRRRTTCESSINGDNVCARVPAVGIILGAGGVVGDAAAAANMPSASYILSEEMDEMTDHYMMSEVSRELRVMGPMRARTKASLESVDTQAGESAAGQAVASDEVQQEAVHPTQVEAELEPVAASAETLLPVGMSTEAPQARHYPPLAMPEWVMHQARLPPNPLDPSTPPRSLTKHPETNESPPHHSPPGGWPPLSPMPLPSPPGGYPPPPPNFTVELVYRELGPLGLAISNDYSKTGPERRRVIIFPMAEPSFSVGALAGGVLRGIDGVSVEGIDAIGAKAIIAGKGRPVRLRVEYTATHGKQLPVPVASFTRSI